jgi:hypothetical protein
MPQLEHALLETRRPLARCRLDHAAERVAGRLYSHRAGWCERHLAMCSASSAGGGSSRRCRWWSRRAALAYASFTGAFWVFRRETGRMPKRVLHGHLMICGVRTVGHLGETASFSIHCLRTSLPAGFDTSRWAGLPSPPTSWRPPTPSGLVSGDANRVSTSLPVSLFWKPSAEGRPDALTGDENDDPGHVPLLDLLLECIADAAKPLPRHASQFGRRDRQACAHRIALDQRSVIAKAMVVMRCSLIVVLPGSRGFVSAQQGRGRARRMSMRCDWSVDRVEDAAAQAANRGRCFSQRRFENDQALGPTTCSRARDRAAVLTGTATRPRNTSRTPRQSRQENRPTFLERNVAAAYRRHAPSNFGFTLVDQRPAHARAQVAQVAQVARRQRHEMILVVIMCAPGDPARASGG